MLRSAQCQLSELCVTVWTLCRPPLPSCDQMKVSCRIQQVTCVKVYSELGCVRRVPSARDLLWGANNSPVS